MPEASARSADGAPLSLLIYILAGGVFLMAPPNSSSPTPTPA
ncbi:hypothetical protein [Gordonia sp. SL306]|nr:hypothetical protein [Gordonia sp. SL306]WAC57169.1 hypothetical protein OVA31_07980 [Gordonia sp. SL306]